MSMFAVPCVCDNLDHSYSKEKYKIFWPLVSHMCGIHLFISLFGWFLSNVTRMRPWFFICGLWWHLTFDFNVDLFLCKIVNEKLIESFTIRAQIPCNFELDNIHSIAHVTARCEYLPSARHCAHRSFFNALKFIQIFSGFKQPNKCFTI